MTRHSEVVVIEGKFTGRETTKAVQFKINSIEGMRLNPERAAVHWFPLSQMKSASRAAPGSDEWDYITVSRWIYEHKNFEFVRPAADNSTTTEPEDYDLEEEYKRAQLDDDIPF